MSDVATIQWLGTAGFRLRHAGRALLVDPFLSRPAGLPRVSLGPADLAEVAVVLCTHGHFDHAMDLGPVLRASPAELWAPRVVCERLAREGIAPHRLHANEDTLATEHAGVPFRILPADHIRHDAAIAVRTLVALLRGGALREVLGLALLYPMGSNSDFQVTWAGRTLYLAGSLGPRAGAARDGPPDLALLPYNGRIDLAGPLLRACHLIRPRRLRTRQPR
jgi:L-ascorbate metabolism protein UlaG (beta-lactamase superfamily)